MLRKIIESTDWKYIWLTFDDEEKLESPDGIIFHPTKTQDLGNWLVRFSNSHYIILTKLINNG